VRSDPTAALEVWREFLARRTAMMKKTGSRSLPALVRLAIAAA
jgi:hypothetical protein